MTYIETELAPAVHRLHHLTSRPARSFPFPATIGASVLLVAGAGLWVGEAIEETTGAGVARCVIGDGSAANIVNSFGPFTLNAGQSRNDQPTRPGIIFERGLVVTVTAGTVAGSLYAVLLSRDELAFLQAHTQGFGGR